MDRRKNSQHLGHVEWWTVREVANLLRYDASTIRRWCETGKIRAAKMPGGTWRIHESIVSKLQAGGLPEQRRQETARVDPVWESGTDHFAEEE
jgi:excisionase family DNA binding protein